jgi:hypothetical protein
MAITAPEPRHNRRSHTTIVATALPERSTHRQLPLPYRRHSNKYRDNPSKLKLLGALCASFFLGGFVSRAWLHNEPRSSNAASASSRVSKSSNGSSGSIRPSSVDNVVKFLMKLAEKKPGDLYNTFMDGGSNDPFSLSSLESGTCPFTSSTIEWLPPRPAYSSQLSSSFASWLGDNQRQKPRKQKHRNDKSSSSNVLLWYEHISKAGGTAFCGLANSNMPKPTVPRYHCMPRKGELMDGRVGSWSNDELIEFINENEYRVVSNEWDPFDLNKLQLSGRDLYAKKTGIQSSPSLMFVTTLRDPADRLLSSYSFFSDHSDEEKKDPKNWGVWMRRNLGRAANFHIGKKSAFRANIARKNYMVWRFSGGDFPPVEENQTIFSSKSKVFPSVVTDTSVWKHPFETAVRVLSQHDLILPMDVMTQESGKKALEEVLGWTQFSASGRGIKGEKESGHVVTTGEVRNSNAKSYLEEQGSGEEFQALWERNWLDFILWYWSRAVFFARLHCNVE